MLEVGRTVHARLSTLSGHLTRLGSALGSAMTRYNETVGSYESSVLVAARRFDDLGVAADTGAAPRAGRGHRPRPALGAGRVPAGPEADLPLPGFGGPDPDDDRPGFPGAGRHDRRARRHHRLTARARPPAGARGGRERCD